MATYSEPLSAVLDWVAPKEQYLAYHDNEDTLMAWLGENCRVPFTASGEYFRVPIITTHTDDTTEITDGTETFSTTPVSDQDSIRNKVAGVGKPVVVLKRDTDIIAGQDKNRVFNFYLAKVKTSQLGLRRVMAAKIFGTNSTDGKVIGLQHICDDDGTTYAGQTVSANTDSGFLTPHEDSTTTTISFPAMENLLMRCYASTDIIITNQTIYGYMWALAQPYQRLVDTPQGGEKQWVSIGTPFIRFNNKCQIVWDVNCPSACVFFLSAGKGDVKNLMYFTHREYDMKTVEVCDRTPTQEVRILRSLWYGQLMAPGRKYQGYMSAITG